MMKKLAKFLSISTLFLFSSWASAGFFSATYLMQVLEKDMRGEEFYETGVFSGYIVGVHDAGFGILFCTPNDVSIKQIKHVVFNYMNNNPDKWGSSASDIVIESLEKAWPCN
tara:strand:- start:601 stop:936 length:336 start_codon:yes stop_codon:yes gene_type:complete